MDPVESCTMYFCEVKLDHEVKVHHVLDMHALVDCVTKPNECCEAFYVIYAGSSADQY